ncbi:hypothetical protein NCAS_0B05470 [Naumovozyma castellii]|uniref:Uncharacterized protein n=1 Tax=Naumovozyma castellii TaxID=27288 RepID=G0V9L5_NAUCA|nr:hypothetical protein NCAS_0B05470 [Naumovozyma castellii CBS 4309]CCC68631.1 hypothetical protein NCAS_0B05470 [Naumovozyma castellii CBS 4309]
MESVSVRKLKRAALLLALALIINIIYKVASRCILKFIYFCFFSSQGKEYNEIFWWQKIPSLERVIWKVVDYLEN